MTTNIKTHCPRCDHEWDAIEFPAQSCFGCGYPEPHVADVNQDARDAVEGYAWWPRVDVDRYLAKADRREAA